MINLRAALLIALASLALGSCGSSTKGGTDYVALCKSNCEKYVNLCYPNMGTITTTALTACQTACTNNTTGTSTTMCTNASEIAAAAQACSAKTTCTDLMTCLTGLPACQGGTTGAAGHTGSTGAGGGPGSSSGACGASLQTCCAAAMPAAQTACQSAAQVLAAQGDATCNLGLGSFQTAYCPTGPGTGAGGGPGGLPGLGGASGTSAACAADLTACCAAASSTNQAACSSAAQQYIALGEATCSAALSAFKISYCPATSSTGTCLPQLLACCNRATGTNKTSCQEVYQAYADAGASGEIACSALLPTASAVYCP